MLLKFSLYAINILCCTHKKDTDIFQSILLFYLFLVIIGQVRIDMMDLSVENTQQT